MGTKLHPDQYDCYGKLKDDEPYFILRAQDELAPDVVEQWANRAQAVGTPKEKVLQARRLAADMRLYPGRRYPT